MAVEGELIAERYRLVLKVGRGAMGVVWRAHDELLDRIVAVKQLLLDTDAPEAEHEVAVERAVREGRIAARLQHPNAVTVHDVVVHEGRPCLVMEYLASKSLAAVVASHGRLSVRQTIKIGAKIASALAAAHQAGIVHRDIKPENVLIGSNGKVKITDFGLSRAIGEGTMTRSGLIAGTPGFLAPEVAGGADAGYPSDVFSLGATLYTAIEGKPPFGEHDNTIVLLMRAAGGDTIPPQHAGSFTPMLMSLLERDPDVRPTMQQAHRALLTGKRPAPQGKPVVAAPEPEEAGQAGLPPTRDGSAPALSGSGFRRGRRPIIMVMAAVMVVLGVVLGFMVAVAGDRRSAGAPTVPSQTSPARSAPTGADCEPVVLSQVAGGLGHELTVQVRNLKYHRLAGWQVAWVFPNKRTVKSVHGGTLTQSVMGNDVHVKVMSSAGLDPDDNAEFTIIVGGDDSILAGLAMRCVARMN